METDVQKLLKIQNTVKKMIANGESPDYIDGYLAKHGENADSISVMNKYGAENLANSRKAYQERVEYSKSIPQRLKRAAQVTAAGIEGGLEGLLGGAERYMNASTLGGYGWLNRKLGGSYAERQKDLQDLAESAGLGTVNKIGNLAIDIGGVMKSPIYKVLPNPMAAQTTLGTLGRGMLQGGVGAGIQSAFNEDTKEKILKNAGIGSLIGGGTSVAFRGLGNLSSLLTGATTGKGQEAVKGAYSAGQRGSKAFKAGRATTAEEIVNVAREGRNEIQKAADRAISEGKNAIGKMPVDKQGLYDSLRDFAQKRFMYDGINIASKGEQKVLNEAEKIINKLTKKPNLDVKTLDVLKQQIYKIVPETSNDAAAIATRNALYGRVSDYLNKAAPEYASIMKPYSLAMDELSKIANETGVKGKGTNITTAINKLIKTSKNPETSQIIQKLGGQNLADTLAGYDLRNYLPDTQIGRAIAVGIMGLGNVTAGNSFWWLPLMSPRLVGDVAYKAGQLSNFVPNAQSTANILNYLRLKQ